MPSVQRVNWAKFRVAAVSAAAAVILLTLIYLLTGGTLLQERAAIYLYLPDATGVGPGSFVRVNGIGVGKVQSVGLSGLTAPDRVVKLTISVERDRLAEIPADSSAQISAETLVGDMFVDVTSGTSATHVAPGGEIAYKTGMAMPKSQDLDDFNRQLRIIDAVLSDIERGRSRVGQLVTGENEYADLRKRLTAMERGIRNASDATTEVGRALNTDALYRSIADPLEALDRGLARLQSAQEGVGQFLRDPALYDRLRQAAGDLRSSIAGLRANDLMRSETAYFTWSGRLQSLIQSVDDMAAGPMFANTSSYDDLNGAAQEFRDLAKEFRQDPKKFLRMKLF
jgi:ABC-type transporter Mla subunit MlaD